MVADADEMNEMSPWPSVASIFAALSVMLEILLTSAESGPLSCVPLMVPVKLGGPPPAWNGRVTLKSLETRPQPKSRTNPSSRVIPQRFWGVQGGASSTLVEAPQAPDRPTL